ncbi:MAG: leucine-rich repeat domain-containing protein [Caldilineales bacterium]|nr:leucine-rich repeat domain-containing protein [Caldilineales bacterium]MDW8318266.1 leucine-rich repeat domain-containing protein [Anaerolineae bacterium]
MRAFLRVVVLAVGLIAALAGLALGTAAATAPQQPTASSSVPWAFDCAEVQEIPLAECRALVDLFQSTNGPQWDRKLGWLQTYTPCSTPWRGVTCADGHVASLQLQDNNLSGPLPASLGDLRRLQSLNLANNDLTGSLPSTLGALAALESLLLSNNQLSGPIPSSLGNLTALRTLALDANQLSGPIPAALGNLAQLQTLNLSSNQLSGSIPGALGGLSDLRELRLGSNQLSGPIPDALSNLAQLRRLALSRNQLSGPIPAALAALPALEELWLDTNRLEGEIPAALGNLATVRLLNLSRNRLSGALPPALGNLTALQELGLASNRLTGPVPDALCNLSSLLDIDLNYNAFTSGPACLDAIDTFWRRTQTVPPTNLQAAVSANTVRLTWMPIRYAFDQGYYEISMAAAGGEFRVLGATESKLAAEYTVTDLADGVYTFRVRTFTAAHEDPPALQINDLWSEYTDPVTVTVGNPRPRGRTWFFPRVEARPARPGLRSP